MSAPSSDPPLPPNDNNNDNKDASSPAPSQPTNAQTDASETQPLLSSTDEPSGTTEDVAMEDSGPKTEEDKFEDIPEGVLSVSLSIIS